MDIFNALLLCSTFITVFADCPAGVCDPHQTCCAGAFPEEYRCCVLEDGVCCEDQMYCCPKGTVCDLAHGACIPEGSQLLQPDIERREGEIVLENVDENEANLNRCDKRTYCPDSTTCCELPNGQHNCCPFPNASCCPDKRHCCPQGEKCDSTSTYCIKEQIVGITNTRETGIPFV